MLRFFMHSGTTNTASTALHKNASRIAHLYSPDQGIISADLLKNTRAAKAAELDDGMQGQMLWCFVTWNEASRMRLFKSSL